MKINLLAIRGQVICPLLFKVLLMFKLIICFICAFSIRVVANPSAAQEKVSLLLYNSDLKTVLRSIEKQTKIKFIYSDNLIQMRDLGKIQVSISLGPKCCCLS